MKKIVFILSIFFLSAFTSLKLVNTSLEVEVKNDSEVSISGTTNINSFNCCYNINKLKDPIPVTFQAYDGTMVFQSTVLELENDCFDCGHKAINKDFNKLLKTEVYPKIKLKLKEIRKATGHENTFNALVEIYIADKVNSYEVPVTVENDHSLMVMGEMDLNLEDFDLKAPKKALGLIVVHDEIKVSFRLHLAQI